MNGLDLHAQMLMEEYRSMLPVYRELEQEVPRRLKKYLAETGLAVASVEQRVKTESSLEGKLRRKGGKYQHITDLTDILGVRVITFYSDDVDKVASMVERLYEIDWENSIDKRKVHDLDRFGYLSLHYICRSKEHDGLRFEVQIRTILQHAWASLDHDTGYKTQVEIPTVYLRNINRLAGMLELIDDEFSRIRRELSDYRRQVQSLVASGNLAEVRLDGDSFRSFLAIDPFRGLNRRIASINQAEIQEVDLSNFLPLFKSMGFHTLGDIDRMIKDYSEAAYQIACFQMGVTDLDIVSSSVAPQNLCMAYILKNGGGRAGLKLMLDTLNGPSPANEGMAAFLLEQSKDYPFMNQ